MYVYADTEILTRGCGYFVKKNVFCASPRRVVSGEASTSHAQAETWLGESESIMIFYIS